MVDWNYVLELICGKPSFEVEDLRKDYQLSSFEEDKPPITWFWSMLKSWSPEDRIRFLRFVSGASSLPDRDSAAWLNFQIDEKLIDDPAKINLQLPTSSTCFNSLHLPRYTDEGAMRAKFLYAIQMCDVIDADYNSPNQRHDEDDEDGGPADA